MISNRPARRTKTAPPCKVGEWDSSHLGHLVKVKLLGISGRALIDGHSDFFVGAGTREGVFFPLETGAANGFDLPTMAKFVRVSKESKSIAIADVRWCHHEGLRHLHFKLVEG
jgi:hypothetical protein